MNILFVCSGNSCRSPMAATYFNHLCKQNKIEGALAVSAGISAEAGASAPEAAVQLMSGLGVDMSTHIARELSAEMIESCEAVFCMEKKHLAHITKEFPAVKEKARMLLSLVDSKLGVEDPFGGDDEMYQQCFLGMLPALAELADRLIRSK